jgi:hypothetical protein
VHDRRKRGPPFVERHFQQIAAVDVKQIEGVEDDGCCGLMVESLKGREAALIDGHQFAVQERGVCVELCNRAGDRWIL